MGYEEGSRSGLLLLVLLKKRRRPIERNDVPLLGAAFVGGLLLRSGPGGVRGCCSLELRLSLASPLARRPPRRRLMLGIEGTPTGLSESSDRELALGDAEAEEEDGVPVVVDDDAVDADWPS